jgi:hypothetical protein
MNKKWGNREGGPQRLKGIFSSNSPRKMLILMNQTSKRGHYRGIMCYESLIEINEPKKTLNIPNNGLNLMKVHVNIILRNNITQEFHLRLIESTFF